MHTSHRVPDDFHVNPISQELGSIRERGLRLLDLTVSNPTICAFDYPQEAILAALSSASTLAYEPDSRGAWKAREAVAAWHGRGVQASDLTLTASTSEAYSWLFKLLGDPGDDVLVPSPSYPLFEHLARMEGLQARHVPSYFHERWVLDLEALEAQCTERTRALVAVNPNNPTGQFLSRSEWRGLVDLCERRHLALIVDEVFADYVLEAPEGHLASALEEAEPPCPLFVLSGLSKIAALPQVKLGWIIARGRQAWALQEPLAFIADQFLSVSAPAQAACRELLRLAPGIQAQVMGRLHTNLAALDRALAPHPQLSRLPVEGGWSAVLQRPAVDSDEACALRLLRETQVFVHPGHFFDFATEGRLVISLLTPPETLDEGLRKGVPYL